MPQLILRGVTRYRLIERIKMLFGYVSYSKIVIETDVNTTALRVDSDAMVLSNKEVRRRLNAEGEKEQPYAIPIDQLIQPN